MHVSYYLTKLVSKKVWKANFTVIFFHFMCINNVVLKNLQGHETYHEEISCSSNEEIQIISKITFLCYPCSDVENTSIPQWKKFSILNWGPATCFWPILYCVQCALHKSEAKFGAATQFLDLNFQWHSPHKHRERGILTHFEPLNLKSGRINHCMHDSGHTW